MPERAPFGQAYDEALETFKPQKQIAMDFAYEIPTITDLANEAREDSICEFNRLTCLRVTLKP
ncbi:MAG TPA: hypothetical protein ENK06_05480 [Gammaproteobacteria bacterium]|nr:hypothetical protein [Gammaproteobacteria bacterium]